MYPGEMENGAWKENLTFLPRGKKLGRVDDLRVKTRGHLDADDAGEEQQVQTPEIRLFVPWYRVVPCKS